MISGKFPNSGKFQNNTINDVKQISLSHVIKDQIPKNTQKIKEQLHPKIKVKIKKRKHCSPGPSLLTNYF